MEVFLMKELQGIALMEVHGEKVLLFLEQKQKK